MGRELPSNRQQKTAAQCVYLRCFLWLWSVGVRRHTPAAGWPWPVLMAVESRRSESGIRELRARRAESGPRRAGPESSEQAAPVIRRSSGRSQPAAEPVLMSTIQLTNCGRRQRRRGRPNQAAGAAAAHTGQPTPAGGGPGRPTQAQLTTHGSHRP